ncbi:MAG TPA: phosphatase PAP2 family protein [Vicinamibacterales bacterium]|nr:phosphatase PAP2 family protein [Vicinamibacterales bacterium]
MMAPGAQTIARRLASIDVLAMAFLSGLGAIALARLGDIPAWPTVAAICAAIVIGVPLLAWVRARLDLRAVRVLHDWSFAVYLLAIYRAVLLVNGPLHGGRLYDGWLIASDRWIFGVDPTVWIARFAHPIATEIFQVAYWSYYVIPLAVGAEFYLRGREWPFRQWLFVCGFGFFVTYVGYLLVPAISPRFTLHDPGSAARELPGLWLTPHLRAMIDAGGMAPVDATPAEAMRLAPRGAFPSGHSLVTLLTVAWAWRRRLRVRWFVTVAGALLLVATVYLRYHYVTDLIAGALLASVCYAAAPALHGRVSRRLGTLDAQAEGR